MMQERAKRLPLHWLLPLTMVVLIWTLARDPVPEVNQITAAAAQALLADGDVLVLDVRERDAYDKEHLPNAVAVPIDDLKQRSQEFEADKANDVVVYCGDGSSRGQRGTDVLNQAGFTRAVNLEGGLPAWRAANLPTVK